MSIVNFELMLRMGTLDSSVTRVRTRHRLKGLLPRHSMVRKSSPVYLTMSTALAPCVAFMMGLKSRREMVMGSFSPLIMTSAATLPFIMHVRSGLVASHRMPLKVGVLHMTS